LQQNQNKIATGSTDFNTLFFNWKYFYLFRNFFKLFSKKHWITSN